MPNFVSFATSLAQLAHAENCLLTHAPSLFDVPGTKHLRFRIDHHNNSGQAIHAAAGTNTDRNK